MPGLIIDEDDVCINVTEECNSNCIMCPISKDARKRGNKLNKIQWEKITDMIPAKAPHLTITGGEPFLEYKQLIPVIKKIQELHPDMEILILTNGRILSIQSIYQMLQPKISEKMCFAIPIHADTPLLHDQISGSPGSFSQTMRALQRLKDSPAKIEIRIVGHKLNASNICRTIRMLTDSDLRITTINLIAMEVTGSAAHNRDDLWFDYQDLCSKASEGIYYAIHHGMNFGLYNFPLCLIPKGLWPIAKKSITPAKVRYYSECQSCSERNTCGGLFYSTYELNLCKIHPIKEQ